jgi:hypothetical protein
MPDLTFKRGDVGRPIVRQLRETLVDEVQGTTVTQPIDLSGATQVKLLLKDHAGSATGGGVCAVTDAAAGMTVYLTQTADVNVVRLWDAEWEITRGSGDIETVPNDSYISIAIIQDLG